MTPGSLPESPGSRAGLHRGRSRYKLARGPYAMDASGSHGANRAYYDAFSERYEERRGRNDPGGYHELLDALESDFV